MERHEVMHFFALLSRIKVLSASRVKCWKRGTTPMEMCLERMLEDTLNNVSQSVAYNFNPSYRKPNFREFLL